MDDDQIYIIDTAEDDIHDLDETLVLIAGRMGHLRIVSITWQPSRTSKTGDALPAGYTIVSEIVIEDA